MSLSYLIWALQSRDRVILRKTIHSKLVWFVRLLVFNERYIYTSKWDDAPHRRGVIGLHNPKEHSQCYWQWRSHWGVKGGRVPRLTAKNLPKNWEKEGKKSGKIGKKRKNREEKAKIGKVLSLCPSWQTGLAMLLVIKQWLSNLLLICKL